ncbi:MAG: OsmC family protein [Deltaproteobacteria bacterium]|nr:OsmC family protein [Deltaproteobacteria bacterium]
MSTHLAKVVWQFQGGEFTKGRYSREHTWSFDGGITVAASPTPAVVPAPWSNPAAVDPEEAFVASLSSCHMLTFLFVAAKAGFEVLRYEDNAVGMLTKNERGVPWISDVELHPKIEFAGGKEPHGEQLEQLHHRAHDQCFIANSVKTNVSVVP